MESLPDFWLHAVTCWFIALEDHFKVNRITRQGLRFTILSRWLMEDLASGVSDVLVGHPSEKPCDDYKDPSLERMGV